MMERAESLFGWVGGLLNTGIAGTQFTPLKMVMVIVLLIALVWVTGRVTHWLVRQVLEKRGLELGLAETLGTLVRYAAIGVGLGVILQGRAVGLPGVND